jgi:CRP-like cAMP-binding protein
MGRGQVGTALRGAPFFSHCSRRELAQIVALGYETTFASGQELMVEGGEGESVVVVLEGSAEIARDGERINVIGPGALVGEIALLTHADRTATVRALEPLRAFVVPGRSFRALLGRQPELQGKVFRTLAERAPI